MSQLDSREIEDADHNHLYGYLDDCVGYRQGSDCQVNKEFREELEMYELPTGPSDIEQHDLVSLQDYGDSQPDNKQLKRKRDVKAEEK